MRAPRAEPESVAGSEGACLRGGADGRGGLVDPKGAIQTCGQRRVNIYSEASAIKRQ
jgi:hypothetical protein